MRTTMYRIAAVLALASSGSLLAAPVEPPARPCINNAEMHGAVAYFLPNVLAELSGKCAAAAPEASYFRTVLPRLIGRLQSGRDAAWPQAKAAFLKFSSEGGKTPVFANLPDEALRPIVDQAVTQEISIKMGPSACGEAGDVLEALSPLDPDQAVHLVATILNVAARGDKSMRSCPRGS